MRGHPERGDILALAIGKALNFSARNKETLVLVAPDHETGGMGIPGGFMAKG